MRIAITGANGQLGRLLLPKLALNHDLVPIVRRPRARERLMAAVGGDIGQQVICAQPWCAQTLTSAIEQCEVIVHLVGTIRETAANRFHDAHESAANAVIAAAKNVGCEHIIYLSILGASNPNDSEILVRRAAVERSLCAGFDRATVIRVPMVLGGDDRASRALVKQASRKSAFVMRAASLEQPIYAGDVIEAINAALTKTSNGSQVFDLAGPTSVSRGELIQRVATLLNNRVNLVSLPRWPILTAAKIIEMFKRPAAMQSEMLKILDHDDHIDPLPHAHELGIELTPLESYLPQVVERVLSNYEATA